MGCVGGTTGWPTVCGVVDAGIVGGGSGVGAGTEGIDCVGVGTGAEGGCGAGGVAGVCADSVETISRRAGVAKKREVLVRTDASNFPLNYRHQCTRRAPGITPPNPV